MALAMTGLQKDIASHITSGSTSFSDGTTTTSAAWYMVEAVNLALNVHDSHLNIPAFLVLRFNLHARVACRSTHRAAESIT